MTTFTTKYIEDGITEVTARHEGTGPLYEAGAPRYWGEKIHNDTEGGWTYPEMEIHYGDPTDHSQECLKENILAGRIPQHFEPDYYLLVRTGAAPNVHYFPLPIVMEQVLKGTAPRWMRKRFTEIKKHLGLD